jgi:hypothetical protein
MGREPRIDEGTASSLSWKWQGAPRIGRQTPSKMEGTSNINPINVDWMTGDSRTLDSEEGMMSTRRCGGIGQEAFQVF